MKKALKSFFKYFNPIYAVKTGLKVYQGYKDWQFYTNAIERMQLDGFFEKHNMQVGKQKQIYLGVDLPPETLMQSADEMDKFERQIVARDVAKYNEPFFNYGIFEYLETATERIKDGDHYGYIVMFSFNFKDFQFWKLIYCAVYALGLGGVIAWLIYNNFGMDYINSLIALF